MLLMIDFHRQEDTRTGRSFGTKRAIRPGGKDAPELEKGGWVGCDEVTCFEPLKMKGFNMILTACLYVRFRTHLKTDVFSISSLGSCFEKVGLA